MTTMLTNYVAGRWQDGSGESRSLYHAVTGERIAECSTGGIDFAEALAWGRDVGGPALRALTFPQRAALLKDAAKLLAEHKDELDALAATYGATKKDAWMDVDGGIGNLHAFASIGRKQLPDLPFAAEGDAVPMSKGGSFGGQHIMVPREGVVVQINAFNFPSWGMLEKLAPSIVAGMPSLVKPATPTALLAWKIAKILIDGEVFPAGALQIVCGSAGDVVDHMTSQDVLAFTGSAATGAALKGHPNVVANNIRVNLEADSLNAIVLGSDVAADSETFGRFLGEIRNEMTGKAGQKCTAIRRIIVPAGREQEVIDGIKGKLAKVVVGDPAVEGVTMGPLVGKAQLADVRSNVAEIAKEAEIVLGDPERKEFEGGTAEQGGFCEPILLRCDKPLEATNVHAVEAFGPVATVMPYADAAEAAKIVRMGGGSLVSTVYTEDDGFARDMILGSAAYNGRMMVMNAAGAAESTGHGVAMPQLVHGGPGRAGGGEELGGLRAIFGYMQRTALQGHPERLASICTPPASDG